MVAEAARGRGRLVERRMQAAVARIDQPGDYVDVRVFQFRHFAPLEHEAGDRIGFRETLQHLDAGCESGLRFLSAGNCELAEEHVAQLHGRTDIELLAGEVVDAPLQRRSRGVDLRADRAEFGRVDGDAGALHFREDCRQRHFHIFIQA